MNSNVSDFCLFVPDEIILIIMGFLLEGSIGWEYKDGHGSIESQRAAGVCKQVVNFGLTCKRFYEITHDRLFWKQAAVPSGFALREGLVTPVFIRSLRHARLLFQPQTLYQVWRPGEPNRIILFDGETQTHDVIFCKHVIPPTAAGEIEPTRGFYLDRATKEHASFPGRCYSIFYSVYISIREHGPFRKMNCYTKQSFYTKFLRDLRVSSTQRDNLLKKLRLGKKAIFAIGPDLWFTIKRMDVLQKPRGTIPPKPRAFNRKPPRKWNENDRLV